MLGGPDGASLFMMTAEWRGFEHMMEDTRSGQVVVARAPSPGAGRP
jgi:sugar lactone lactonase YvrE